MLQYSESDLPDDLKLVLGGRDHEREVPAYPQSPTWIVNRAFEKVQAVIDATMSAYLRRCSELGLQHSYVLGLDILISGEVDANDRVVDIKPTLVEGPCCNSKPACPYIDSYRLYRRAQLAGLDPDRVESPLHPTKIHAALIDALRAVWQVKTGAANPVIGVLSRVYADSREETALQLLIEACRDVGLRALRIAPEDNPTVANGKLVAEGVPIDVCQRNLPAYDMTKEYGEELGRQIVEQTPETLFFNPWEVDVLRSKAIEEEVFRSHEVAGGQPVSRPRTLIGPEATPDAVAELFDHGGYALKHSDSTGGRGVFLHVNLERANHVFDNLYGRYDGHHMQLHGSGSKADFLAPLQNLAADTVIQQLRVIDSRPIGSGVKLAYDLRVNLLFNAMEKSWTIISGISRGVPMGLDIESDARAEGSIPLLGQGNSLLTNVSSGAHIAPLIMGTTAEENMKAMTFGSLLTALNQGENIWVPD